MHWLTSVGESASGGKTPIDSLRSCLEGELHLVRAHLGQKAQALISWDHFLPWHQPAGDISGEHYLLILRRVGAFLLCPQSLVMFPNAAALQGESEMFHPPFQSLAAILQR